MNEKDTTIQKIIKKIIDFRSKRDWKQFHNPKNLAISISLESAELLENFQWKDLNESIEYAKKNKGKISEEIADILIYIFYLCEDLGIDFIEAIENKIKNNEKKYPVDKSKGNSLKYDELK